MSLNRHMIREEAFQVLFALQSDSEADIQTVYEAIPCLLYTSDAADD